MSRWSAFLLHRLRRGTRMRAWTGWVAAIALLVATLGPEWQAFGRPDAGDPFASLCINGTASGGGDGHPFGNACVLCTLAHTAPDLGTGAPQVAQLDYAPPEVAPPTPIVWRAPQSRAPTARAPPVVG
jgi:hypothetical protein